MTTIRKIAANILYHPHQGLIKQGFVIIENGNVKETGQLDKKETASTEFHNGLLLPGFVNAHCHLELSNIHIETSQIKGLGDFIEKIVNKKKESPPALAYMNKYDRMMSANGISLVADIISGTETFPVKERSQITYVSFIELLGLDPTKSKSRIKQGETIKKTAEAFHQPSFFAAHSPYSCSENLLKDLIKKNNDAGSIFSIHNQESESENALFQAKESPLQKSLARITGKKYNYPSSRSSYEWLSTLLPAKSNILLVHNTFSNAEDIKQMKKRSPGLYPVLCPNANLLIEKEMPPVQAFYESGLPICLGTDSIASNTTLSILEEIKQIHKHFPEIPLTELLRWGTLNGARALGMDHHFGSFKKGSSPGVILIQNMDMHNLKLKKESTVRRIA